MCPLGDELQHLSEKDALPKEGARDTEVNCNAQANLTRFPYLQISILLTSVSLVAGET